MKVTLDTFQDEVPVKAQSMGLLPSDGKEEPSRWGQACGMHTDFQG